MPAFGREGRLAAPVDGRPAPAPATKPEPAAARPPYPCSTTAAAAPCSSARPLLEASYGRGLLGEGQSRDWRQGACVVVKGSGCAKASPSPRLLVQDLQDVVVALPAEEKQGRSAHCGPYLSLAMAMAAPSTVARVAMAAPSTRARATMAGREGCATTGARKGREDVEPSHHSICSAPCRARSCFAPWAGEHAAGSPPAVSPSPSPRWRIPGSPPPRPCHAGSPPSPCAGGGLPMQELDLPRKKAVDVDRWGRGLPAKRGR
jgi:hypothetical protein